ncbi:RibD family protein [Candidatus Entotheonella palauensis]|uniref:RibD family protein n=1 Tax=Candidatus Entotheonella palauensis TaxID=93172 RepID=UPI000B7D107F|nr:RibD family protein [Candidatus Entotheonella palauensis]
MPVTVGSFEDRHATEVVQHGWSALCELAMAVKAHDLPIRYCSLRIGTHSAVRINACVEFCSDCYTVILVIDPHDMQREHVDSGIDACYRLRDLIHCELSADSALPQELHYMIRVYAPYCFASMYAKRWQRAFAVSHFAQSLDGRIATESGDAKWIGNDANLIHAHRMRALCDGILIGAKTLARDKPQLTVRHVPGSNPTRIVLGSAFDALDHLKQVSAAPICLISPQAPVPQDGVETVHLKCDNGLMSSTGILAELYQRNIHSVYIEGGAKTTSHFLREGALDVVQLHIAPMIFGSGLSAFAMPQIQYASESLRFASHTYVPVDNDMMFVGTLQSATG